VSDCQRIIVSTSRERNELVQHCDASPQKIRIIPCGVNLDLFRPLEKTSARSRLNLNGEDVLLFVGRLVPAKGLANLLMALPYLESKRPIRLLVVGGNDQPPGPIKSLRNLAKELSIEDRVTFLGSVEHQELPWYYSAADICVIPSFHETFGLVALESLACGTPVVSTRVGAMEKVIQSGHTGYVVNDNTPAHLAATIVRLLSGFSTSSKSADAIRASVLPFSWARVAEAVERECTSVLKRDFAEGYCAQDGYDDRGSCTASKKLAWGEECLRERLFVPNRGSPVPESQ